MRQAVARTEEAYAYCCKDRDNRHKLSALISLLFLSSRSRALFVSARREPPGSSLPGSNSLPSTEGTTTMSSKLYLIAALTIALLFPAVAEARGGVAGGGGAGMHGGAFHGGIGHGGFGGHGWGYGGQNLQRGWGHGGGGFYGYGGKACWLWTPEGWVWNCY